MFETFVKDYLYVDKSLLIKEIVKIDQHLFISAPRRWGKSLNINMLKTFFSPIDKEKNALLFENLKIKKDQAFFQKYQGNHPVVKLNFQYIKEDKIKGIAR